MYLKGSTLNSYNKEGRLSISTDYDINGGATKTEYQYDDAGNVIMVRTTSESDTPHHHDHECHDGCDHDHDTTPEAVVVMEYDGNNQMVRCERRVENYDTNHELVSSQILEINEYIDLDIPIYKSVSFSPNNIGMNTKTITYTSFVSDTDLVDKQVVETYNNNTLTATYTSEYEYINGTPFYKYRKIDLIVAFADHGVADTHHIVEIYYNNKCLKENDNSIIINHIDRMIVNGVLVDESTVEGQKLITDIISCQGIFLNTDILVKRHNDGTDIEERFTLSDSEFAKRIETFSFEEAYEYIKDSCAEQNHYSETTEDFHGMKRYLVGGTSNNNVPTVTYVGKDFEFKLDAGATFTLQKKRKNVTSTYCTDGVSLAEIRVESYDGDKLIESNTIDFSQYGAIHNRAAIVHVVREINQFFNDSRKGAEIKKDIFNNILNESFVSFSLITQFN